MPALAELTGKMVFLPLPYVTLCHFFLQTPYSLCYSLKIGKTKALNRRIFICVYGCLSISHYIKGDEKVQKLQFCRSGHLPLHRGTYARTSPDVKMGVL